MPAAAEADHTTEQQPAPVFPKILISVPRRTFKRANVRNRIKRLIREAYRLSKQRVFEQASTPLPQAIGFIYVAKEVKDFDFIREKLVQVLQRMLAAKNPPKNN